jgi:hypothetical protein
MVGGRGRLGVGRGGQGAGLVAQALDGERLADGVVDGSGRSGRRQARRQGEDRRQRKPPSAARRLTKLENMRAF